MGYSLTYYKNIDHGRANGLLFGEYIAFLYRYRAERAVLVLKCMDCANPEELIVRLRQLLGTPEKVTEAEIEKFTAKVMETKSGSLAKCIVCPDKREIARLYKNSFGII
jgi:alcohol dehydrogenase class IV